MYVTISHLDFISPAAEFQQNLTKSSLSLGSCKIKQVIVQGPKMHNDYISEGVYRSGIFSIIYERHDRYNCI